MKDVKNDQMPHLFKHHDQGGCFSRRLHESEKAQALHNRDTASGQFHSVYMTHFLAEESTKYA